MKKQRENEAVWLKDYGRWQIKVQVDGVRKTFSSSKTGRKGKLEAEAKADEWLENTFVGEKTRVDVLLEQWFAEMKESTSQSNWKQQQSYIKNWFRPLLGSKRIGDVRVTDLQRVIDTIYRKANNGNGASYKTLKNIRAALSSFLKYCRYIGATNLTCEFVKLPRGAKPSMKTIATPEDLRILFTSDKSTFNGKPISDPYINAYRFQVVTGLRPSELIGLEKRDIKSGKMTISRGINQYNEETYGKNANARRTQILPSVALNIIADQEKMLRQLGIISKYVFPAMDGDHIETVKYCEAWKRYCAENHLSGAHTPYELRHTFVSVVDEMPTLLKKQIVGHSQSMDTEGIYGHRKQGDMERAALYIDEAFNAIIKAN